MKRVHCIGGPLDGMRVTSAELRPEIRVRHPYGDYKVGDIIRHGGIHAKVGDQYLAYNNRQSGHGPKVSICT